jgi:hypothetical protein
MQNATVAPGTVVAAAPAVAAAPPAKIAALLVDLKQLWVHGRDISSGGDRWSNIVFEGPIALPI